MDIQEARRSTACSLGCGPAQFLRSSRSSALLKSIAGLGHRGTVRRMSLFVCCTNLILFVSSATVCLCRRRLIEQRELTYILFAGHLALRSSGFAEREFLAWRHQLPLIWVLAGSCWALREAAGMLAQTRVYQSMQDSRCNFFQLALLWPRGRRCYL